MSTTMRTPQFDHEYRTGYHTVYGSDSTTISPARWPT